jgi:hypothetical protein
VDIQHGDVEVGNLEGFFKVPGLGKGFVGDNQLFPEFLMGGGGDVGKKTPVKLLDKLKNLEKYRVYPLTPQEGLGKGQERGKSPYFPAYNPAIKKGKYLIFRCVFSIAG